MLKKFGNLNHTVLRCCFNILRFLYLEPNLIKQMINQKLEFGAFVFPSPADSPAEPHPPDACCSLASAASVSACTCRPNPLLIDATSRAPCPSPVPDPNPKNAGNEIIIKLNYSLKHRKFSAYAFKSSKKKANNTQTLKDIE